MAKANPRGWMPRRNTRQGRLIPWEAKAKGPYHEALRRDDFEDNRGPGGRQKVQDLTQEPELDNQPQLISTYLTRFSFSSARNALQDDAGYRSKSMTLSAGQEKRAFGGRKFVPGVVAALARPIPFQDCARSSRAIFIISLAGRGAFGPGWRLRALMEVTPWQSLFLIRGQKRLAPRPKPNSPQALEWLQTAFDRSWSPNPTQARLAAHSGSGQGRR